MAENVVRCLETGARGITRHLFDVLLVGLTFISEPNLR